MTPTLPVFNTTAHVWRDGVDPLLNAPALVVDCQLYIPSRGVLDIEPSVLTFWQPPIYLRVPKGTPLEFKDIVECPPGSGWFYLVRWIERMHLGFPNEYFVGLMHQLNDGVGPLAGFGVLLEDGFYILQEDASFVLAE